MPAHVKIGCLVLFAILVHSKVGTSEELAPAIPGIASEKPATGPVVEVGQGVFMVPYVAKIPGTDLTFEMVPVPGGKFLLGSPDSEPERNDDEGPQIEVTVDPMWVGKHEVNWAQYEVFMSLHDAFQSFQADKKRVVDESNRVDAVTAPTPLYEPSFTLEYGDEPDQPAVTMTQYAAQQYTKWLSRISGPQYRLPTEAEWEYAARAGSTAAYSWGDSADEEEISKYATYADNNDGSLPIVGSRLPNAFGLHDMLGGVGEWTVNQYDEAGYGVFAAKAPLKAIDVVVWPTEEFPCVVRGGTWQDEPAKLRCAARVASHPDWKEKDPNFPKSVWWCTDDPTRGIGFRLFRSYQPLPAETITKFWETQCQEVKEVIEFKLNDGRAYLGLVDPELPEALNDK